MRGEAALHHSLAACVAFGCDAHSPASAPGPSNSAAANSAAAAGSSGLGAWPPPSLHYFSAYDRLAAGISVDDRYVYWYQHEWTFMRGLKTGVGEPKALFTCACDMYQFVADSDTSAVYVLSKEGVLRVDRES